MAKTTRQSFQFMLRLPDDMRDALRAAAEKSGRSVTAEILARLEETFGREAEGVRPVWLTPDLWERIEHEANVTETDPSLIILEAIERAFPAKVDVTDRLRALSQDVVRRGMEHTPEGREILEMVDKLITKQDQPRRVWKKD